jgi:hypothetical protein
MDGYAWMFTVVIEYIYIWVRVFLLICTAFTQVNCVEGEIPSCPSPLFEARSRYNETVNLYYIDSITYIMQYMTLENNPSDSYLFLLLVLERERERKK